MMKRILVWLNGRLKRWEKYLVNEFVKNVDWGEEKKKYFNVSSMGDGVSLWKYLIVVGLEYNFGDNKKNVYKLKSEDVFKDIFGGFGESKIKRYYMWKSRLRMVKNLWRLIKKEGLMDNGRFMEFVNSEEGINKINEIYGDWKEGDYVYKKVVLLLRVLEELGYKVGWKFYGCIDYNILISLVDMGLLKEDWDIDRKRRRSYIILRYMVRKYGIDKNVIDSVLFKMGRGIRKGWYKEIGKEGVDRRMRSYVKEDEIWY